MNNLKTFNLVDNKFSVSIVTHNLNGIDDYCWTVCVFNLEDKVSFELPQKSSDLCKVLKLAEKVFNKGTIDLTLWNPSEFHYYTCQNDIDEGFVNNVWSYEVDELIEDEDGEQAYQNMIEQQVQNYMDSQVECYGRY